MIQSKTQIAKQTGLSRSTVIRFFNGSSPVKPENRKRILDCIGGQTPPKSRTSHTGSRYVIGIGLPGRPSFFWDVALEGIRAAAREYPKELLDIEVIRFSGSTRAEEETLGAIDMLESISADAYMIVPVSSDTVKTRLENLALHSVVAVFNNYIDFKGRFLYAGSHHFEEGQKAATILIHETQEPRKILIVSPPTDQAWVMGRVGGFVSEIQKAEDSEITGRIILESYDSRMPSLLAREISKMKRGSFNCIYVADGAMHFVGSALGKLGLLQSVFCVGHELSHQSEKQFEAGLCGACIRQDIFSQGYITVKRLAEYILNHTGVFGTEIISGYETMVFRKSDHPKT